jgi:hypothetical protein
MRLIAVASIAIAGISLWPRHTPVASLLDRKIAKVDFRGIRLEEALKQLGTAVGAPVVNHYQEPAGSYGMWDTPIFLQLHDVELRQVINRLHTRAELSGVWKSWAVQPQDGSLVVTAMPTPPTVVRAYDLHDLIELMKQSRHTRVLSISGPSDNLSRAIQFTPRSEQQLMGVIEELIRAIVLPDVWGNAGVDCMIQPIGKRLIIAAPLAVHEEVQQLLRDLRASAGGI